MDFDGAQPPEHYRLIADFIYEKAGIRLGQNKITLVESRLLKRRTALGLKEWKDYAKYLRTNMDREAPVLIEALTTHKTEWFREAEHYEYLSRLAAQNSENFFIWSAACSTGEEAYSAALTLLATGRTATTFRILGTDISRDVVDRANRAEYATPLQGGPLQSHALHFQAMPKGCRVAPELRQVTKFRQANLLSPQLPGGLKFDVVFLRNVLIYFDVESSRTVIENILQHLKPGGVLFLGLSESLRFSTPRLKNLGQSIFLHEPDKAA